LHPLDHRADEEVRAALNDIVFAHDLLLVHLGKCRNVYSTEKIRDGVTIGRNSVKLRTAIEHMLPASN
jgi:hypothetical protein